LDQVIAYIKELQKKGYKIEYKEPDNPELVMVHIPTNKVGVIVVEARIDFIKEIRGVLEHN